MQLVADGTGQPIEAPPLSLTSSESVTIDGKPQVISTEIPRVQHFYVKAGGQENGYAALLDRTLASEGHTSFCEILNTLKGLYRKNSAYNVPLDNEQHFQASYCQVHRDWDKDSKRTGVEP